VPAGLSRYGSLVTFSGSRSEQFHESRDASLEIINEGVRRVWIARVRKIKETAGGARGGYVTVNGRLDPQSEIAARNFRSLRDLGTLARKRAHSRDTVIFLQRSRARARTHTRGTGPLPETARLYSCRNNRETPIVETRPLVDRMNATARETF